jgi:hypothetical protein
MAKRVTRLASLRAQGFDRSTYTGRPGYYAPRCSQCEVLVINGIPCHETRCPNIVKEEEEEEITEFYGSQQWAETYSDNLGESED